MNLARAMVGLVCLVGASALHGQYAPPSRGPYAGAINELLRRSDTNLVAWDVGGSWRLRYEMKENGGATAAGSAGDFRRHGVDNDNAYWLSRVRARVGYRADWWEVLVEGRHSSSTGDDRGPNAGPESDGPVDLHQAFVRLGNPTRFPLSLKVGRQELAFGEDRVVGAFGWNNVGRVFDGGRAMWQSGAWDVSAFGMRVVVPNDNNFNLPNDYDWFSGVYAVTKQIPRNSLEFYFLARNVAAESLRAQPPGNLIPFASPRDIYTAGFRLKSNPGAFYGWDYTVEIMGQFGHFNDPRAGVGFASQEHQAYAVVLQGGYTFTNVSWKPRVGLEYSHASGDDDPQDDRHGTFENLFPTNHKFYGYMDFLSLQNLHDLRWIVQARPHARLSLALEGHAFWLADTHDNFYNVAGAPRGGVGMTAGTGYGINPQYNHYLGSELDFIAGYALTRWAQIEAGYGHFFTGSYVKQSFAAPTHGAQDADYFYLQFNAVF